MEPDTDIDLTELMTEDEILMLEDNKIEPESCCVVALMSDLRVSEPDAQGGRVVVSQGYLPASILKAGSSILTPGGRSVNPFDGAIPLPPVIRLIVKRERLERSYLDGIAKLLQDRVQEVPSAGD